MVAKLTPDVLQELDRTEGRPVQLEDPRTHQRYVLISDAAYQRLRPLLEEPVAPAASSEAAWTDAKNAQRCALIDREIADMLTPEERVLLDGLQREMLAHRQQVAPLPIDDLRQLHSELLQKARAAKD